MSSRMAANSRSDLASGSPEVSFFTSAYLNGQRGSYPGASFERSGSFRESIDNRVPPSSVGATRSPAQMPAIEIPSPSNYLTTVQLSLGDQKYTRAGELRRVVGVSPDEHTLRGIQCKALTPAAAEELKRFKASVLETAARARERTRVLLDSSVKLERYLKLISRKRQRNDLPSNEKSGSGNLLRTVSQVHQNPPDLVVQRHDDRAKSIVSNKRVRSSMGEMRAEGRSMTPLRQGPPADKDKNVIVDKDKNMLRACNGVVVPAADKIRTLPPGGEVCENKTRKKRPLGTVATRTTDGDREFKVAVQRLNNDSRPRHSNGPAFRSGSSTGIISGSKNDGSFQLSGSGGCTTPRDDLEDMGLSSDQRERSAAIDKEWNLPKGGNKYSIREDPQIGSQRSLVKGKSFRGPRSASTSVTNTSPSFPRTSGLIDSWDPPPSINKAQHISGTHNRKRPLSESSSPPVSQWGGQRLPKSTRTKRMTLVSPVSNHDDAQAVSDVSSPADAGARVMNTDTTVPVLSRTASSTHQLKLKFESVLSPIGATESDETTTVDNKPKEKGLNTGEMDEGVMNAVQKVATLILPSKKNKLSTREEVGDGVRRHGRSGRNPGQFRAGVSSPKERTETVDLAKPLRTGKPISEISKVGRPPLKKVSDRKASSRPGQAVNSCSSDPIGESDDDHDELLAAANSARSASYQSCSSPFWKKMDQFFSFVSEENMAFLRQQMNFVEEVDLSLCSMADIGQNLMGDLFHKLLPSKKIPVSEKKQVQSDPMGQLEEEKWLERIFPLSQMLLAAFIVEKETEICYGDPWHDGAFVDSANDYSTASLISRETKKAEKIDAGFEPDVDFLTRKNCFRDNNSCAGYGAARDFRSPGSPVVSYNSMLLQENNILPQVMCYDYGQDHVVRTPALRTDAPGSPYDCQYEHMCLDDKILVELQNVGLFPDAVPGLAEEEDEEIDGDLLELKKKLYEQIRTRKHLLRQLDKAIHATREADERRLEQIAMDKLVELAYKKYVRGRGGYGSSNKGGVSRVSRQVALAFAQRVLARCRKFEDTGLSCFGETTFRDILSLHSADAKPVDTAHVSVPSANTEAQKARQDSRLPASGVSLGAAGRSGPVGHKPERDLLQGLAIPDEALDKQEAIASRGKKREPPLLDEVVSGGMVSRAASALGTALPSSAKGKRSERDRDPSTGARNSLPKASRSASSTGRGERKARAKPKQTAPPPPSTSESSPPGPAAEAAGVVSTAAEPCESLKNGASKGAIEETMDFISLPLDSIDGLDVGDGLGGQGQDLGSWLNLDDDALQDDDLMMGLEIPMDDLSELNMNMSF